MAKNEIMENIEVIEATEVVEKTGSKKGWKVAAGIGVAALVGGLIYKFAIKPMRAKRKAELEQDEDNEVIETEEVSE